MTKTCQRCGEDYEPTGRNQKFCPSCRLDTHRERCRQYARVRRQQAPDECLQYQRNWQENHREKTREYCRRWRKNNPEKVQRINKSQYERRRALRIRELKKARLRAKLQAAATKHQAEQLKHKQLYQNSTDWDDFLHSLPLLSRLV